VNQTDRDWLAAVRAGHPPAGFGHREHLRLAWLALESTEDLAAAEEEVSGSIRAVAAAHGEPQKYHQTVTSAWLRIVRHARAAQDACGFDELLAAAPWLFDKRLLLHHYSSQTLASESARNAYVEPDLLAIPA
jgi:hypothetical protein